MIRPNLIGIYDKVNNQNPKQSRFTEKNKRKSRMLAKLKNNAWMLACVFGFGYLFITGLLEAI